MASMLTQVQKDCLEMRGICAGCPNNVLESQECMVKFSQGVARKLGIKGRAPARIVGEPVEPVARACRMCEEEFTTCHNGAKFCARCLATKPAHTSILRVCEHCEGKFFGHCDARRCTGCREASSIQRERRARQPAKSA